MGKKFDVEGDRTPMTAERLSEAHPHLAALRKEFRRHRIAYMIGGVCLGAVAAGTAAGTAGHFGAGWNKISTNGEQTQSVTVMESETESRGWFTRSPTKQKTAEEEEESAYCFQCDNAPSRGWGWAFGYGTCECHEGFSGACCDTPTEITDLTHGPYMGDDGTYELYTFYTKDTADHMIYSDCSGDNSATSTSVPPEFSGLWWMDGNPASDYVASFGRSNWQTTADGYSCVSSTLTNQQTDETFNCLGGMDLNVYDENIWSWHDEALGKLVYGGALGVALTYKFECGGDDDGKLTYCQIYPNAAIPVTSDGWVTVPASLVSFDMTRGDDNLWIRNSIIAGLDSYPHNYYLKKIVNCDGTKGEHWDDYLSHGKAAAPVIPDVFGNGADDRETVSNVHERQLLSRKL
ncbi:hypothetical protein TrLO_g9010 [Triparma laevis f. longispina]|uniref:Uncharacterized protein n=1 Tax=Triparma laevis f. longispina TaxID=1714387 RepID=A0A9W7FEN9_9STRA|nr:hypothetical protein TrLO_g9010 [Triparma laevis f. longispina]